jgi:polyisoprenoid-binding protein YceI
LFDVARHPHVRFVSDTATAEADTLAVSGSLRAAGKDIPLEMVATLRDSPSG